jgi:hypothetical protein
MPGLGWRRATGKRLQMRPWIEIETFSCRQTNFAETSTANEGWRSPGSQGWSIPYYEPTQIRTSWFSFAYRPAGFKQPSHFLLRSRRLQVGPLGHPRPWLFRESRSCVVGLVARQSTGWVGLSFQFRVSSWIVIAAHRRKMYLVGGRRSPGHSPFRQWPFSPWSIWWSVQGQKLEHIDSARSRPSLQGLSLGVVSTSYCRAAKLTLVH